jgi:capping protein beta
MCDYNRDGDSHRSPWSNKYSPEMDEDAFFPSARVREIEIEANELFDTYRMLYYEGGVSSVYLWDIEGGFAGCFLIKKNVSGDRYVNKGSWDSINVVEVNEESTSKANYKLTSTVILHMEVDKEVVGKSILAGSLTRQTELNSVVDADKTHLANIGRMIEDQESEMRNNLNELYIQKTREIVNSVRNAHAAPHQTNIFTQSLNAAVLQHGMGRKVGDGGQDA